MNDYCLTAAEAAEQAGIDAASLTALIARQPSIAIEVNGAVRVAPAQLAAALGAEILPLAA
jgi:uncharacterized membrane protein